MPPKLFWLLHQKTFLLPILWNFNVYSSMPPQFHMSQQRRDHWLSISLSADDWPGSRLLSSSSTAEKEICSRKRNQCSSLSFPPTTPSLRAGEKRYTKYIQWPRDRVWSIIWKNYHSKIPSFSLVGILLVCWEMCIHTVQCTYTVIQVFSYCKFLGSKIWGGKLLIFI